MGGDMRLKKLKAARAKWLEKQQAQQRPHERSRAAFVLK